jgi:hypothetical protein
MPYSHSVPATEFFLDNFKSGYVHLYEETFSGAVVDQLVAVEANLLNMMNTNNYALFLQSASAPAGAVVTFKKGTGGSAVGCQVPLTADNPLATGSTADQPLLRLLKGQRVYISTSAAVPFVCFGLWVPA